MFVFKPTNRTYADPVSATFIPGIPFGREFSRGDICLLNEEFSGSMTFLNSRILRDAILASKEYLEEVLGLQIKDATKDLVSEEEVQAVAEAIIIEAEEQEKSVEEVVAGIVEEAKEDEATKEVTETPEAPAKEVKEKKTSKKK